MDIPFRPDFEQIPTLADARRLAPTVMRRLRTTHLLVWVLYADDTVGLHKFNANGSHRKISNE